MFDMMLLFWISDINLNDVILLLLMLINAYYSMLKFNL